jgi:hypothetical protein
LNTNITAQEFEDDILPTLNADQIREEAVKFYLRRDNITLSEEDLPEIFEKIKMAIE